MKEKLNTEINYKNYASINNKSLDFNKQFNNLKTNQINNNCFNISLSKLEEKYQILKSKIKKKNIPNNGINSFHLSNFIRNIYIDYSKTLNIIYEKNQVKKEKNIYDLDIKKELTSSNAIENVIGKKKKRTNDDNYSIFKNNKSKNSREEDETFPNSSELDLTIQNLQVKIIFLNYFRNSKKL